MKTLPWILPILGAGCQLAELEPPVTGTCSEAIQDNRWPKFEGNGGEPYEVAVSEIAFTEGQVAPDFELIDQFGEPTCLWQMQGRYVILDASALWCDPCKQIAKTVACVQETYGDQLAYLTFITQDTNSQPADQVHAEQWASEFGLNEDTVTPVIADGQAVYVSQWPGTGDLPSLVLLDPELRVLASGNGQAVEIDMRNALEDATGISAEHCHP